MKKHLPAIFVTCLLFLSLILWTLTILNESAYNLFPTHLSIGDTKNVKPVIVSQEVIIKNNSPHDRREKGGSEVVINLDEAVISDNPLPPKVYEAQKNKISIELRLYLRGYFKELPIIVRGTGYVYAPGHVSTARHILMETILKGAQAGYLYHMGASGLPEAIDYTYQFLGGIANEKEEIKFPLSLEVMGELDTFKDIMVLRVDDATMAMARNFKPKNLKDENPYAALLNTATFNTDAHLNEEIFMSGMHDIESLYIRKGGTKDAVLSTKRNYTFEGRIVQKIEHLPINKLGIKRFYDVKGDVEPGFSGGPAFNVDGEVIGMIIEKSEKFPYLISSLDILDFLREHKLIKN